jgi:hypothetical protein
MLNYSLTGTESVYDNLRLNVGNFRYIPEEQKKLFLVSAKPSILSALRRVDCVTESV